MIISWFIKVPSDTEEEKYEKHMFDTSSDVLPRVGDTLYFKSVKYRVVDSYHKVELIESMISALELKAPEGNERWEEMEKKLEDRGEHFVGLREGFIKSSKQSGQVILVKA